MSKDSHKKFQRDISKLNFRSDISLKMKTEFCIYSLITIFIKKISSEKKKKDIFAIWILTITTDNF